MVVDLTSFLCIGIITISGDVTYDSDQLTLACISTGGPATTVSWTRDSTTVITEGTETVLNDPVTAQYTHTLTVTGVQENTLVLWLTTSHPLIQLTVLL